MPLQPSAQVSCKGSKETRVEVIYPRRQLCIINRDINGECIEVRVNILDALASISPSTDEQDPRVICKGLYNVKALNLPINIQEAVKIVKGRVMSIELSFNKVDYS